MPVELAGPAHQVDRQQANADQGDQRDRFAVVCQEFRQGALDFGAGFFLGCGLVDLGDPCLLMDSREVWLSGCTTAAPFQRLSWPWNGAAARLASASEVTTGPRPGVAEITAG